MTEAVVLLSGGMDSAATLALAVKRTNLPPKAITALSFNYGQRHRVMELDAAVHLALFYGVKHHVVDLQGLGILLSGSALTDPSVSVPDGHYEAESMRVTVVPNRNAIMLSIAFGVARAASATRVYAGMHAGDHAIYPDCRASFILAYGAAMNEANADLPRELQVVLTTPFIYKSKTDIVKEGTILKVPFNITYSCYKGGLQHCGTCGTCNERREAFQLAGVKDPTTYATKTV